MSYWKNTGGKNYQSLDQHSYTSNSTSNNSEFFELEPAVVLDIILDENHVIFDSIETTKLDVNRWPSDVKGEKPLRSDIDYTWVGRALVRLVESQKKVEKESLVWAYPLDANTSEYPLLNEVVVVVKYLGKTFYTTKINYSNFVNSNENFLLEPSIGGFYKNNILKGNRELTESTKEYTGPVSKSRHIGGDGFEGVLGRYFLLNKNIRAIKRFEGDTVIESRFGQSIRFSAYDNNRKNDVGIGDYKNKDGVKNPYYNVDAGGGNPMIIIRNRQRQIKPKGESYKAGQKVPPVIGTEVEKNVGGYIEEDINNDGSTIAITSGMTISKWATNCYKQMFQEGLEEQTAFSPPGCTKFKFPVLDGDQIIINSDRLILSSRNNETFHYSKKRYGIVTDSEYTVDAHDQIVLNTNTKTVINSPAIYLGQYDETSEPVLLGQTTVNWLYNLLTLSIKLI